MPTSAAALQNLVAVEELDRDLTQLSLRLDHRLTSADQLLARVSTLRRRRDPALRHQRAAGVAGAWLRAPLTTRTRNAVVSHTRVLGNAS